MVTRTIAILHGSPRKNQNSDTLAAHCLEGIAEKYEKNEIIPVHFYLNEMSIRPCQGCFYCNSHPTHDCAIQDDMQSIYSAYKQADIIIFATPMYWGYLTAQMKIAIDRMEALAWDGFGGKRIIVIMTYRHHYQSTQGFFERIAPFFHLKMHYLPVCTMNSETHEDIPIAQLPHFLSEARHLGNQVGEIMRNEQSR